jgi:hypothetical protein
VVVAGKVSFRFCLLGRWPQQKVGRLWSSAPLGRSSHSNSRRPFTAGKDDRPDAATALLPNISGPGLVTPRAEPAATKTIAVITMSTH